MSKPIIQVENTGLLGLTDDVAQDVGIAFNKTANALQGVVGENAPFYRAERGINRRDNQVMSWRLPNGSAVQMYINPQSLQIREAKQINATRTKGGFVVQYWGEELTQLNIQGTTGSSGVEGINILRDIYRSEMRGFDLIATQLAGDVEEFKSTISGTGNSIRLMLEDLSISTIRRQFLLRPSLASLAVNVVMHYQGVQYKGFFKDFTVTEDVNNLGLFYYTMTFMATETRGRRKNFMAWHKSPTSNDAPGQLLNAVGNSVRGLFGLSPQPPQVFHPGTAPYTFGGNSLSAGLGFAEDPITLERTIFI